MVSGFLVVAAEATRTPLGFFRKRFRFADAVLQSSVALMVPTSVTVKEWTRVIVPAASTVPVNVCVAAAAGATASPPNASVAARIPSRAAPIALSLSPSSTSQTSNA